MYFSLIIPTIRRKVELENLLFTLTRQTYLDFEVIIVDQNENLIDDLIIKFSSLLQIKHLKVLPQGASAARNFGVQYASGNVLTFPDDDCYYNPKTLEFVYQKFQETPSLSLLCGRSKDEQTALSHARFGYTSGKITLYNAAISGIEFTMFISKNVFLKIGGFDETLGTGAGTFWGSGEAYDFILRNVNLKYYSYYSADLVIYHPAPFEDRTTPLDSKKMDKLFSYARGFGYVLNKNKLPIFLKLFYFARSAGGMLIAILKNDLNAFQKHKVILKGKFRGWLD